MEVILYVNSSDPRVVNKNIRHVATLNCDLYGDADIATPTFKLGYSSDYISVNYVYVPEFKRYYFCKSEVTPGRIMYLHCNRDVLMSYASEIKGLTCTIVRQEFLSSPLLPDKNYRIKTQTVTHNYYFSGTGFGNDALQYNYVLSAIGGSHS